jgi:hypothetical protein
MPPRTSLQLEQDLAFQRRSWRFQQIGRGLLAMLVLAAVLGSFGGGMLSRAHVEQASITLDYERMIRAGARTELAFKWTPAAGQAPTLRISRAYLDDVRVHSIDPQPLQVRAAGETFEYLFAAPHDGGPMHVCFEMEALHAQALVLDARIADGESLSVRQLVLP